ncbi:MAG: hypothetical protein ACJ73C_08510 [Nitrososphaeraceae archaeon]
MNLRLYYMNNSQSKRDKVISYLHQCKQCGLLFERIRKGAASNLGEFSWDRKFMVDKCDTCKNFGLYNVFS